MNFPGAKFISQQEFKEQFELLFDSIFIEDFELKDFPSETPFKNKEWRIVLLPDGEMRFGDVDLLALIQAAHAMGDKEIVILNFDEPNQAILPLDYDVIHKAGYPPSSYSSFGMFDSYLFGRSGTWGIVSYFDSFFCVGGNKEFMDVFIRKAGGEQALKERFIEYMNTEWYPMLNAKLKPNAEKVLNDILARVGWNK